MTTERLLTNYLDSMGITHNLTGYHYIRDAVRLLLESDGLPSMTKVLYPAVAKKRGTTPPRVERGIRHAIERTFYRMDARDVETMFGNQMDAGKGKMTNSQFLALLADRVRLRLAEDDFAEAGM